MITGGAGKIAVSGGFRAQAHEIRSIRRSLGHPAIIVTGAGTVRRPWFLEAGLYCSFARKSVVAMMAEAEGIGVGELFATAAAQAAIRLGASGE